MSERQVTNPLDLLGQADAAPPPVHLPGDAAPQLEIGWGEFRQSFSTSLSAALNRSTASRKFLSASFFKDSWIERRIPRRAIAAAALWHLVFLALPMPQFSAPRPNPAFDNTVLTWSGPIEDLPLLEIRAAKPKPSPRGQPEKPLPPEGADAFHPRQRIFTDPVRPTHPRQTLINPAAPPDAPKFLPALPNIVQLAPSAAPARPHLQISEQVLKQLRPRERRAATTNVPAPAPEVQNNELRPSDLPIAASQNVPARPKLELNTGAAPRAAERKQNGEAAPPPELASAPSSSNGAAATFIALSATPGPPAPIAPPQGNLAARIAISPEGKQNGVPGGVPNPTAAANGGTNGDHASAGGAGSGSETGKNDIGVSISGGNPSGNTSGLAGAKPKLNLSAARPSAMRSAQDAAVEAPPVRSAPPNFSELPPDARPEAIFASKRIYTLHVNMPNLNSATGSWIMNFSELRADPSGRRFATSDDVSAPQPLKKVDPKYPPSLIADRVEGEVILYAVIRRDGSVDSIQLIRGIDEQLDENSMHALAQWKFRPAEKQGETVDLEAIVHIPFRAPSDR